MRKQAPGSVFLRYGLLAASVLALATPALAQWTRVTDVPVTQVFSVWSNRDTIVAGADTSVYLSTDAGATWRRSARPAAGTTAIEALRFRNGRLFAGTYGQGVFVSDDRGATWSAFNQGLTGGVLDSQLFLSDFALRGDSLIAATVGAGVWVRSLAPTGSWQPFGSVFEPNQAANVNAVAIGNTRLVASAGGNGMVFVRDPGDADWAVSNLDNIGIHAGLQATEAVWTGSGWVVGSNLGLFRSATGEEPWTRTDPGLGVVLNVSFATRGRHLFAAFDLPNTAVIEESDDDGASWPIGEILPGVFIEKMTSTAGSLYAARADGLWRRPVGIVSVPDRGATQRVRFAASGPQPFRDQIRLRFELPSASRVAIEVFDVQGRVLGTRLDGIWPSGSHEVALDAHDLRPGVYTARLTAEGTRATVRLVRVR